MDSGLRVLMLLFRARPFESLTWLRSIGASVFLFGGVIPLTWFITSRANALKKETETFESLEEETPVLEKV